MAPGRLLRSLLPVFLVAALSSPARAALPWQPQGGEVQVNAVTPLDQFHPAVASDGDGRFLAVWSDRGRGLFARLFSSSGQPLSGEVRVDDNGEHPGPTRARMADRPRVAFDPATGGWAVTYAATDGIFVQRLNSLGQTIERFGIPYNATGEALSEPDAAFNAGGELVVVWKAVQGPRTQLLMQRFDGAGRQQIGASPVNQQTAGDRGGPRIALDPWSGDAIVTWIDVRETGNPDVWLRRLSADGQPRGPESRVELDTNGEALGAQPLVHGDGGYSVVWSDRVLTGPSSSRVEVTAQRFDLLGGRLGTEARLTEEGAGSEPPAAVVDPRGDVLVLWTGVDRSGPDTAVLGRLYDDSWDPLSDVFQVNSYTAGEQTQPALAVDAGGRFLALWASHSTVPDPIRDSEGFGVFGRLFTFPGCTPGDTRLCLAGGRFQVEVTWRIDAHQSGPGHAVPLTGDTGVFWFFQGSNLELLIKVLDGRAVNGHFWVYAGALSNVEYTIAVTDTATGEVRTYHNAPQELASRADTRAFPTAAPAPLATEEEVAPPFTLAEKAGCQPAADALCLAGGRFRIQVEFTDPRAGAPDPGHGQAHALTADTGTFWFFDPANLELMVKVLDGRAVNGKFWVFYGALSDVAYTLTVTDTATGAVKTYRNPRGTLASRADTQAF